MYKTVDLVNMNGDFILSTIVLTGGGVVFYSFPISDWFIFAPKKRTFGIAFLPHIGKGYITALIPNQVERNRETL